MSIYKLEKLTLSELERKTGWEEAIIVFTKESFDRGYSEESRSYQVYSDSTYFQRMANGEALIGDCLDGKDDGVRLDWMIKSGGWEVEYCYIVR